MNYNVTEIRRTAFSPIDMAEAYKAFGSKRQSTTGNQNLLCFEEPQNRRKIDRAPECKSGVVGSDGLKPGAVRSSAALSGTCEIQPHIDGTSAKATIKTSGELVLELVSLINQVAQRDIVSKARGVRAVSHSRQLVMYLMHTAFGYSYQDVGAWLGKDRTTIAHACNVIEDLRDVPEFDQKNRSNGSHFGQDESIWLRGRVNEYDKIQRTAFAAFHGREQGKTVQS